MLGVGLGLTTLRGRAAGFSPLDLPNLVGWWDASDTSTITESGGSVSQWDDKSGSANHLVQAASANQPDTGVNTLNGLNVITFTSASATRLDASGVSASQTNWVWSVGRMTNTSHLYDGLSSRQTLSGAGVTQLFAGTVRSTSIPNATSYHMVGIKWAGASSLVRYEGNEVGPLNPGTNSLAGLRVGGHSSGINWADSDVAELIIIDGDLTSDEIAQVESYLAAKWGFTLA